MLGGGHSGSKGPGRFFSGRKEAGHRPSRPRPTLSAPRFPFSVAPSLFLPPPAPTRSLCLFLGRMFSVSSGLCIFRPKLRSRASPRLDRRFGFPWAPCCPPETWGGLGGPGLSRRPVVLPRRQAWHWEGVLVGP